ncbi:uncharacterized protein LOC127858228 [Dreissena polymorpha]|uniref:Uncharacterized protein n=1 Tax=Dreissena polymorpha TaxID=45954 RepID=A0A9D3YZE6_DREPO|nr:uncharacterized protein LOC127858228 [Dreissena polymorpha]KAH3710130.1 hypothetical protein DPMN_069598 [Dreissena polymorpha]
MKALRRSILLLVFLTFSFRIKAFQVSRRGNSYEQYARGNGYRTSNDRFHQSSGQIKRKDCYDGDGTNYRGLMAYDENGQPCIDWADIDGFISEYPNKVIPK